MQPDGALRRIDKIGPINYKGLTTIWEEPTPAYYMYRHRYAYSGLPSAMPCPQTPAPTTTAADGTTCFVTAADRNVDLVKGAEGYHYLYRINCGGDALTDEYGQQWQADDSLISHSWGQDFDDIHPFQASQRHITEAIHGTKSPELFRFFRFGRHRLWYDLPVSVEAADRELRIELYFVEPWHGRDVDETTDYEGLRIFDVAVNGETLIDDLDPWAEAGYCGALKRVVYAKANDGRLRISFPEVKAGQAIICAIAVATSGSVATLSQLTGTGVSWLSLDTDTIAKLSKDALPQDAEARPASVYQPTVANQKAKAVRATTFVIKPGLGQEYALRFRYKNTSGQAVKARMTITDAKHSVLVERDMTFPPTPNKFKMLSTTTGTQINAGTYTVRIDANDVEFKDLEIQ